MGNGQRGKRLYREVFFVHNGPGPYPYYFCKDLVDFDHVFIHHIDHDEWNHESENLVATHNKCHSRHHSTGRKHSAESYAKRGPAISRALQAKKAKEASA